MLNLPKSVIFQLLKSIVKRRNFVHFNHLSRSFDNALYNTVVALHAYNKQEHSSRINDYGTLRYNRYSTNNPCPRHNRAASLEIACNIGELGHDILKPFDVVLSFQFLSQYLKYLDKNPKDTEQLIKCKKWFHYLLIITHTILSEISFTKLALILNSLTNMLKFKQFKKQCFIEDDKLEGIPLGVDLKSQSTFRDSFEIFKTRIQKYTIDSLNNCDHSNIDSHGICLLLKYQAAMGHAHSHKEFITGLNKWISKQEIIAPIDLKNIKSSLSKMNLLHNFNIPMLSAEN